MQSISQPRPHLQWDRSFGRYSLSRSDVLMNMYNRLVWQELMRGHVGVDPYFNQRTQLFQAYLWANLTSCEKKVSWKTHHTNWQALGMIPPRFIPLYFVQLQHLRLLSSLIILIVTTNKIPLNTGSWFWSLLKWSSTKKAKGPPQAPLADLPASEFLEVNGQNRGFWGCPFPRNSRKGMKQ